MTRIAWLGHHSVAGGDGLITYSRETVAALRRQRTEVRVVHFSRDAMPDGLALEARGLAHRLVLPRRGSLARLEEFLRDWQPDVVHVSLSWSALDFQLPRLCRDLGVPLTATFHVPYDTRLSVYQLTSAAVYRAFAPVLSRCDGVVIFGEPQRRILGELGVPPAVVHVIPNGVDVDKYRPGEALARQRVLAEHRAGRLFSYVGRIDPEKNVGLLIESFLAAAPSPDTRLLIVGDGAQRRHLERRWRDPRVCFLGLVREERERIRLLQASDGFFLPSRVEGLSLALLEAMACGTATVATAAGNDGEALRGAGIVLDPRHLRPELEAAFRLLLENPTLTKPLGRQARRRAVERYSLASNAAALLALYSSLGRAARGVAA